MPQELKICHLISVTSINAEAAENVQVTFLLWAHFCLDCMFSYQEDKTSCPASLFRLLYCIGHGTSPLGADNRSSGVVGFDFGPPSLTLSGEGGSLKFSPPTLSSKMFRSLLALPELKAQLVAICSEFGGCGANGKFHAATMVEANKL